MDMNLLGAIAKHAVQKTNSEKNLLTELSDSEICEEAYGRKNGLASHQYVAKHRTQSAQWYTVLL